METLFDMFAPLLKKLFGSKNEREVKRMLKAVQAVNALEEQMVSLSDEQLRSKTEEFKARLEKGETLDKILPKPLPSAARRASASWACVTSTSSSSAA